MAAPQITQVTGIALRKVFQLLEDQFDSEAGCYRNDYSDERIAKETNISKDAVKQFCGGCDRDEGASLVDRWYNYGVGMSPELQAAIERAREWARTATPEQKAAMWAAQRESWIRAFDPCEHGELDWETCPGCRDQCYCDER